MEKARNLYTTGSTVVTALIVTCVQRSRNPTAHLDQNNHTKSMIRVGRWSPNTCPDNESLKDVTQDGKKTLQLQHQKRGSSAETKSASSKSRQGRAKPRNKTPRKPNATRTIGDPAGVPFRNGQATDLNQMIRTE